MSYRILIRKRAENNIAEAFDWYEKQRAGLGVEFLQSVEASILVLQNNPLLFQARHKNIRCALTPRFPYGIYYLTDDDRVVVLSVFHLSRNPKHWRD